MNTIEKKIIEKMQAGMPISEKPYEEIAEALNISQTQLLRTLDGMKKSGLIRRIGLVPNHYAIGYTVNLMTVWDIKDSDIDQVGVSVGALDFVSHCYQRPRHLPDWPYNFFAMVHGKSEAEANDKMQQINLLIKDSCRQFTSLKSTKILKKTGLRI
ncbi:Lrp/AsnC family transcriptional regulator [Aliikangiella sp. G2MR2-5]|uniref:siroheme decarboxylase subunit beta n=1 Tax=Aliikangiella sp. G2MR2-5 TaxID=2788943 RepID=UPI0018AAC790|nr:Lrp/AsnC family transcriptional regulator [Aliikangiella sp. G2MR2-5]